MGDVDHRLRDRCTRCVVPMTVHRAEVVSRPGRLVRLTRVTGPVAAADTAALATAWQGVAHPGLLAIDRVWRVHDGLLLEDRAASSRPLDTVDAGIRALTPAELARAGARIADALTALHEHGLAHGAVSPHTILLGSDGGAVLDGPWHAGCHPATDPADTEVVDGPATPTTPAAGDVRALATTLLALLATAQEREARTRDLAALRSLLENHARQPADPRRLRDALENWHGTTTPDPTQASDRAAARGPHHHPRPQAPAARGRGGRVGAAHRSTVRPGLGGKGRARLGLGALVACVTVLVVGLLHGDPSPPMADPLAAPATGTTSPPEPPRREDASTAAPAPGGERAGADTPAVRPVCPATEPPPGPGRLVLADLDGRGCRAAVRIDGAKLTTRGSDRAIVAATLDLDPDDQVLLGDLDGAGQDEVLVYRPGTGELYRFAGLAGPGEAVIATGQASGWVGGTATLTATPEGGDRLQVHGGTPS
jgi:hypothetical protein